MFITELDKYVALGKSFITENEKFVELSKAFITENGVYKELWGFEDWKFIFAQSPIFKASPENLSEASQFATTPTSFSKLYYINDLLFGVKRTNTFYLYNKSTSAFVGLQSTYVGRYSCACFGAGYYILAGTNSNGRANYYYGTEAQLLSNTLTSVSTGWSNEYGQVEFDEITQLFFFSVGDKQLFKVAPSDINTGPYGTISNKVVFPYAVSWFAFSEQRLVGASGYYMMYANRSDNFATPVTVINNYNVTMFYQKVWRLGGYFVVVAFTKYLYYSKDGVTWVQSPQITTSHIVQDIDYYEGKFYIIDAGGTIYSTTDFKTIVTEVSTGKSTYFLRAVDIANLK